MNQKKSTTLHGTLLYPLMVGQCAMIHSRGQFLRTSRIVAIHSCTAEEICFETMNTNYTLLMSPVPQTAAVSPRLTCMAA